MVLILCFGRQMLGLYVGHAAASDAALLLPATTYIKLRALALPAALVGGVLQAALLLPGLPIPLRTGVRMGRPHQASPAQPLAA